MEPGLCIKSCAGLREASERHELHVSTRRAVKTGREVNAPKTQDRPKLGNNDETILSLSSLDKQKGKQVERDMLELATRLSEHDTTPTV